MSTEKPNIILIVVDSLRQDHLPCYGYERDTAPTISKLAEEGTAVDCYANSHWSVPSHASVFTGDLPSEHEVYRYDDFFDKENELLKGLKDSGYTTYGLSTNPYISRQYGFDKGFDEFDYQMYASGLVDEDAKKTLQDLQSKDWGSLTQKYLHALKTAITENPLTPLKLLAYKFERKLREKLWLFDKGSKKAVKKIQKKVAETEEPFFIFTNLMDAHHPYRPPIWKRRRFTSYRFGAPEGISDNSRDNLSEDEIQQKIDLYDETIHYTDTQIKKLIEGMRKTSSNTVFIIVGDHGDLFFDNEIEFEEPSQGHNYPSIDESLIRVPMVLSTNLEVEEPISLRDLPLIVKSIAEDNGLGQLPEVVSENIEEDLAQTIATDGTNKACWSTETGKHYSGDKKICERLYTNIRPKKIKMMQKKMSEGILQNLDI